MQQSDVTSQAPLDQVKGEECERIDRAAGIARSRFVSPGALIEEEYRQARASVERWRLAGSSATDIPPEIQSGADYSGISPEEAAQEIERTATGYATAMAYIREVRLAGKRAVQLAETPSAVAQARARTIAALKDTALG